MAQEVRFTYYTGLKNHIFRNAKLIGSWDSQGLFSDLWSSTDMKQTILEDGCPGFQADIHFNDSQMGKQFYWGVLLDGPAGTNLWAINTEVNDHQSTFRYRTFFLNKKTTLQNYYFTYCRLLGSNKRFIDFNKSGERDLDKPSICFSVWAPNAQAVNIVFGNREDGYINNVGKFRGTLVDPHGVKQGPYQLKKEIINNDWTGIWSIDSRDNSKLANYDFFDHEPYMFEIIKDDSQKSYRTDIYSRCQIGSGNYDPTRMNDPKFEDPNGIFLGKRQELDGTVSCSIVINPEKVAKDFKEVDGNGNIVWPETKWEDEPEFWKNEFNPNRPLPNRKEDLVIYELHVNGLGFEKKDNNGFPAPGDLEDAINFIDYLVDLGINCVEIMPLQEYEGSAAWGYGTSHFFALEYSAGGRDQYKHFIRVCHQRGIAVILDVVYNHYHHHAERAQRFYDSNSENKDFYHWYEGKPDDYSFKRGGYVDNQSTGDAPSYWSEYVRHQFISSAAALINEFHVDGFRVDQVTSIHDYPRIIGNSSHPVNHIKMWGKKFLREWTLTMKLLKPNVFLIAEDHSGWDHVTKPVREDGLGFDATWYSEFYHQLMGDTRDGNLGFANLIKTAGQGNNIPLAMTQFSYQLLASSSKKVFFNESHDEAGNSSNELGRSMRTITAAVNGKENLNPQTRPYAEARSRFAFGITLFTPSIPMFFMGEEIGASKIYRYYATVEQLESPHIYSDGFLYNKENFYKEKKEGGRFMFRYYQDAIKARFQYDCLKYGNLTLIERHDDNRILAFKRSYNDEEAIVIATLINTPYKDGYTIHNSVISDGQWQEIFNSNSSLYGGDNLGNGGGIIYSYKGYFNCIIPANSVLIFIKK